MCRSKSLAFLLPLLLALGCSAGPAAQDPLAAEWAQLRQQRGYFDGSPWRQDLDAWPVSYTHLTLPTSDIV